MGQARVGGGVECGISFWELALSNMMIHMITQGSSGKLEIRNGERIDFE